MERVEVKANNRRPEKEREHRPAHTCTKKISATCDDFMMRVWPKNLLSPSLYKRRLKPPYQSFARISRTAVCNRLHRLLLWYPRCLTISETCAQPSRAPLTQSRSETLREEALETSHWAPTAQETQRPWHAHSRAYILAAVGFLGRFQDCSSPSSSSDQCIGIFLFGYDTGLGGGVINLGSFQKDFGLAGHDSTYKAKLSGNIVAILQGGAFFGALGGAPTEDYIGRKYVSLSCKLVSF